MDIGYYRSILDLENIGIKEYTWILDTIDLFYT